MATEQPIQGPAQGDNNGLPMDEPKVQNDKRLRTIMMWASIIAAIIVLGIIVYIYAVRQPAITNGNDALGQANTTLLLQQNDSLALQQYEAVADQYGHDTGNLAKLNAAILLYKKGDYEAAAKRLSDYDATESVIGAAAASLQGDCYVNLDKLPEAAKAYREAIKRSNDNPHYTPFFMLKLATVARAQGAYAEEADIYAKIKHDYPIYGAENNIDIEKYLKRAEAQAK